MGSTDIKRRTRAGNVKGNGIPIPSGDLTQRKGGPKGARSS